MFKKYIYTSVGVVSIANDKFKELVEDLIQNGQFTEDEGERIVDTFFLKLRTQFDSTQNIVLSQTDKILKKFNLISIFDLKEDIIKNVNDLKENYSIILRSKH